MRGTTSVVIARTKLHPWITLSQGFVLVLVIGTTFCLAAKDAMQTKPVRKWKNGIHNRRTTPK